MNGNNQIPSLELQLLETGDIVVLAKWLTTGQSRELQKVLLQEGNFNAETGKIDRINPSTFLSMQDQAAEFLIREVKHSDGNVISFSKEWLNNLPVNDGNLVYDKINEITGTSSLSANDKKK